MGGGEGSLGPRLESEPSLAYAIFCFLCFVFQKTQGAMGATGKCPWSLRQLLMKSSWPYVELKSKQGVKTEAGFAPSSSSKPDADVTHKCLARVCVKWKLEPHARCQSGRAPTRSQETWSVVNARRERDVICQRADRCSAGLDQLVQLRQRLSSGTKHGLCPSENWPVVTTSEMVGENWSDSSMVFCRSLFAIPAIAAAIGAT